MSRKPRFRAFIPGAFAHIVQRGVARRRLFEQKGDQVRFVDLLAELESYGVEVHSWCLMPNHVHLVVHCGDRPPGDAMRFLFGRYAQWFNRTRQRVGHLYQERYRYIPVGNDEQLVQLVRYVHLNPVRAGLSTSARQFRWSAHQDYVRERSRHSWLHRSWVLRYFHSDSSLARRQFGRFVDKGTGGGINRLPGSLSSEVRDALTLPEVIQELCAFLDVTEAQLRRSRSSSAAIVRGALAVSGYDSGRWSLRELSSWSGKSRSALSEAGIRFRRRVQAGDPFAGQIAAFMGMTER